MTKCKSRTSCCTWQETNIENKEQSAEPLRKLKVRKKYGSRFWEPCFKKQGWAVKSCVFLHLCSSNPKKRQNNKANKMLMSHYWTIVSSEHFSWKLNSSEAYHGRWPQEHISCSVKHLLMIASSTKKFPYEYHHLLKFITAIFNIIKTTSYMDIP